MFEVSPWERRASRPQPCPQATVAASGCAGAGGTPALPGGFAVCKRPDFRFPLSRESEDWTFWSAATCRRFPWARRVAPIQSGLVRPHSKGQLSWPSNPTFRRHFEWTSNEALGFDNEVAITTGDGAIEPPAGCKNVQSSDSRESGNRAPESAFGQRGGSPLQVRPLRPVTDCHCVAMRRGGEQQEVNDQSVGTRTRFGLKAGEPAIQWRSPDSRQ